MAIYDIVGKANGVPASALIGRRVREWCPIAWWNTKMPPEVLAEEAREAVAAGYAFHKFKVRPWIDVYEQVAQVSAATPPEYRLDVDWNSMLLSVGEATPVLRELDTMEKIAIYETPIPHPDLEGYRQLREKVARPLAVHVKGHPLVPVLKNETTDGFVMDVGVGAMIRYNAISAEFGKNYWIQLVGTGITTAMVAQLGSVMSHARWPAVTVMNNYSDDLLVDPLTIREGYVKAPDGPGLGVEVDEEALERFRMEPPYQLCPAAGTSSPSPGRTGGRCTTRTCRRPGRTSSPATTRCRNAARGWTSASTTAPRTGPTCTRAPSSARCTTVSSAAENEPSRAAAGRRRTRSGRARPRTTGTRSGASGRRAACRRTVPCRRTPRP